MDNSHYHAYTAVSNNHWSAYKVLCCFHLVLPPAGTITPNITTAKVFGSVQFNCSATGFGDLSFAWYHNGSLLQTSNNSVESTLAISRVLPQQQGVYKCTVTLLQKQLSSDSYTTLDVSGKYLCTHTVFNCLMRYPP